jgi:voltage-dependent potassium channel beta subunit
MQYRHLGASGLELSVLSFGSWVTFGDQIGDDVATDCMKAAWDSGVNFFDNAEAYSGGKAETMMGKAIKKLGWKRTDYVVSTKLYWGGKGPNKIGLSRKRVVEGAEASLGRLQLDYVDLIFCHRPDPLTPIEETVRAMSYLINNGKALYWGTRWWTAEQITAAYHIARRERLVPPTMEQPEYNMFCRDRVEREYLRLYRDIGLGTTIWSPLCSGLLTGKYNQGVPSGTRVSLKGYEWLRNEFESDEGKQRLEKTRALAPVAQELGCTMAQMALAWCVKNPNVSSAITGASRPDQVIENMGALDVVNKLTPGVMERSDRILGNKPVPEPTYR